MRLVLAAVVALIAGQASALSCLRPDVARTFLSVAASEHSYIVLLGSFSYAAPPALNRSVLNPENTSIPARFEGQFLGAEGFVDGAALDLTINLTCMASWCGRLPGKAGKMLGFARQTPQGYMLDVDPCGGRIFQNVTQADVERVEACMRGERCEAGELLR